MDMDDPKKRQSVAPEPAAITGEQMRELVSAGMTLGDIMALETRGMGFTEIAAIATSLPQKAGNDADAIAKAIDRTQRRTPENPNSPDISDANPFGDRDNPRPGLKCDWWLGVINEKTKKAERSGYELDPRVLTVWEQLALNTLEPMQGQVERLDGAPMAVAIAAEKDDLDKTIYMTMAFPANVVSKKSSENKNMIPRIEDIVLQLTGHDFRRKTLSSEETLRLMAEHRKGNYDVPRKVVAA
jgi:hypothetical protein